MSGSQSGSGEGQRETTREEEGARARFAENPFYILGLSPKCTRAEMEREGQKLLAMLELGMSRADTYATPVGERERSADSVRRAMAELRDPEKRLGHELWARLSPDLVDRQTSTAPSTESETDLRSDEDEPRKRPWTEARVMLGWGRR